MNGDDTDPLHDRDDVLALLGNADHSEIPITAQERLRHLVESFQGGGQNCMIDKILPISSETTKEDPQCALVSSSFALEEQRDVQT
jgi:hypothetical protein